jgi:hypothetical protein
MCPGGVAIHDNPFALINQIFFIPGFFLGGEIC